MLVSASGSAIDVLVRTDELDKTIAALEHAFPEAETIYPEWEILCISSQNYFCIKRDKTTAKNAVVLLWGIIMKMRDSSPGISSGTYSIYLICCKIMNNF